MKGSSKLKSKVKKLLNPEVLKKAMKKPSGKSYTAPKSKDSNYKRVNY